MVTSSQVNRAGRVLRELWRARDLSLVGERERRAWETLVSFRAAHGRALIKANNGLRSMLRTEGCAVEVSQRLKRVPSIPEKLRIT